MNSDDKTSVGYLAPDKLGPTVTVGEILVEIVATSVGQGFLESQPFVGPFPSGAPAIFIDQCGKFGGQAAMIGAVGNDDFGLVNTNRLQNDDVDISGIVVDPDLPTGSAFVRYRKDGDRDFVFNIAHSAAARFGWSVPVHELIKRAGHLHVMGTVLAIPTAWTVIEKAVAIIKNRGGTISLDPNLRKELTYDAQTEERFSQLVNWSDLLLPSGEELELAAGTTGFDAALDALFERGVKEVVLKQGSKGATSFYVDGSRLHASSFSVEEVDPTGAGDCFGGAYVAACRLGLSREDALLYANAAGARNVTYVGPMEGAGTRDELDHFIAQSRRLET